MSGDGGARSDIPVNSAAGERGVSDPGAATRAGPAPEKSDPQAPCPWRSLNQHFEKVEALRPDTLEAMMAEAGTDVAKLALRLDIGAGVLAAVAGGEVPELPRPRLLRALAYELGAPYDAVARAIMCAAAAVFADGTRRRSDRGRVPLGLPARGEPHTTRASVARPRSGTFEDLVERSSMTNEQKAYWLGDD